MIDLAEIAPEGLRPLSRADYDRLVELGVFDEDERLELLHGMVVSMRPQKPPHAGAVQALTDVLAPALKGRASVRVQLPLALTDDSEPEPDIAVVPPGSYRKRHRARALLVVEVSDVTARKDLRVKARLYASAGVPEYWVVNLAKSSVIVHRDPKAKGYASMTEHQDGEVSPAAFPDVQVAVKTLVG